MTRDEASAFLRTQIRRFAIHPADAAEIFDEVPTEGIDAETLGDYLDGAGYPNLAELAYELDEVTS